MNLLQTPRLLIVASLVAMPSPVVITPAVAAHPGTKLPGLACQVRYASKIHLLHQPANPGPDWLESRLCQLSRARAALWLCTEDKIMIGRKLTHFLLLCALNTFSFTSRAGRIRNMTEW